ncbi:MAG: PKD domain-containing protein [Solirubrobacteraceae bacterium]
MAASQLGRRIPVHVVTSTIVRHGPFVLTAAKLARFRPGRVVAGDDYSVPRRPTCSVPARCLSEAAARMASGPLLSAPLTANLTDPFLKSALGVADPQIAAGPVYLATTQRNVFAIFDKSGVPVSQTLFGAPASFRPDLCDMFSPLLGDLNAHADLPGGATGIDVANGWGFDCGPSGVGKTFYDARIVWDDFRHRYWIAALAINHKVAETIHADKVAGTPVPPDILGARRGKFVVAVSQTDDPRGGWNEYWFDANKGDGQCNPNCTVENGADYPFIGISHHFFLWSSVAGPEADPYRNVAVINADWMASAGSCSFECGWDFTNFNIDPVTENLDPVVDHGAAPDHTAMLIAPRGNNRIALWTLKVSNGSPSWSAVAVNVNPFNGPTVVDQPSTASNPHPQQLNLGNAGNNVMRAVYRDSRLVLTFAECKVWSGTNTCTTAVRLIQLRHTPSGWVVHRDQTLGRAEPPDPPGTVAGYADPEVELNKDGDIAVDYLRSGKTVLAQARYSTYLHNQNALGASQLIAAGDSIVGGKATADSPICCNIDTGGISIDAFDDEGIWMMHGYGHSGGYALGVAKVFGATHPDVILAGINLAALRFAAGSWQTDRYRLTLTVRNQGDGLANATTGMVQRAGSLAGKPLARFRLPSLRSGRSAHVPLVLDVPHRLRLSSVRIVIAPQRRHREYSTVNNTVTRSLMPTAAFTSAPPGPHAGSPIAFNAASSSDLAEPIVSYRWSFGDGSVATGRSATHPFARPGTYVVALVVRTRSGLTGRVSHTVRVANRLPDLAVSSIDTIADGTGAVPTCVIHYTLANVGSGDAGQSRTHVVLEQTAGPSTTSGDMTSAALAAGEARQEQMTLAAVRGGCTNGTTVTVTANSDGVVAESDSGHDTNNTLTRSF